MGRTTKVMEAAEQRQVIETFDATIRSHLQPGEQVRAWVFGRTWPNEAVRWATLAVSGQGALGGGLYGYVIGKHTTGRFLIVTDRRVMSLVEGASGSILEWEATPGEVNATGPTGTVLSGGLLVLRHGAAGEETRVRVASVARKQAKSLVSLLRSGGG
jgi:hypothetical protein